jgi:hypothetical protein
MSTAYDQGYDLFKRPPGLYEDAFNLQTGQGVALTAVAPQSSSASRLTAGAATPPGDPGKVAILCSR